MIQEIKVAVVQQTHRIEAPFVSFEYFMDNYCKQLFRRNKKLSEIKVVVSNNFSFEFYKEQN